MGVAVEKSRSRPVSMSPATSVLGPATYHNMQLAATSYYRFTSFARMLIPASGLYLAAPDSTNGAPNAVPFRACRRCRISGKRIMKLTSPHLQQLHGFESNDI